MMASRWDGSASGGSGSNGPTNLTCGCAGRSGSTTKSAPLMARIVRRDATACDGDPVGQVRFTSRLHNSARIKVCVQVEYQQQGAAAKRSGEVQRLWIVLRSQSTVPCREALCCLLPIRAQA